EFTISDACPHEIRKVRPQRREMSRWKLLGELVFGRRASFNGTALRWRGRRRSKIFGAGLLESGRLGRQLKDGPDTLHARNGLRAGAQAQPQFALEAAHSSGQMHQQQAKLLE